MLTTQTALADLRRRLTRSGFDEAAPRLEVFWPVWQEWSALAVERMDPGQDQDMLLFQSNLSLRIPGEDLYPHDASPPHFNLNFTRQFSHHDEHGDYEGMEHLFAEFHYDPVPEFHEIVTLRRGYGSAETRWRGRETLSEWAQNIEATPSFSIASGLTPRRFRIVGTPV